MSGWEGHLGLSSFLTRDHWSGSFLELRFLLHGGQKLCCLFCQELDITIAVTPHFAWPDVLEARRLQEEVDGNERIGGWGLPDRGWQSHCMEVEIMRYGLWTLQLVLMLLNGALLCGRSGSETRL